MDESQRVPYKYPQRHVCLTVEEILSLFPENIMEILERTLLNIYRQYPELGQETKALPPYCFFAKDIQETQFVIEAMREKNWLYPPKNNIQNIYNLFPLKITVAGWIEINNMLKRTDSKNVFVAMMFNDDTNEAWKCIQKAVSELGFNPIRIDKVEFNDEINGQILLNIRQSAFVIADITGHRNGVYFEAGFAMGLKKEVIFACSEAEFEKKHFDVSHYNIIKWKGEQDLYEKLKDRIQGTMALK
jgi:nucleoside 2-deoxyribosyltransferase